MADGTATPESGPIYVIPLSRESLSAEWSPAKQYREGAFLMMHLGPEIFDRRSSHRLVNFARTFGTDPVQDISLKKDLELAGETVHLDWVATAKKSGISGPEHETSPNLSTLTLHGLLIPETDETITVGFRRIPGNSYDERSDELEFGVQEGIKASENQVIAVLWDYYKKIRAYWNQNRGNVS